MFTIPFVKKIQENSNNILMVGCGGGYDCFTSIPLYFELKEFHQQKCAAGNLILGNLSFTKNLDKKPGRKLADHCVEARFKDYVDRGEEDAFDESLGFPGNYYPEFHLSKWFYQRFEEDVPVYAFDLQKIGVKELTEIYQALIDEYSIDTLILIDAGVDSILKNDEQGLGTVGEDLLSVLAARNVTVQYKYLMCVGLSTEGGISEYDFLENVAALTKEGGYLGSIGWTTDMPSVALYIEAVRACIETNTTINSQIMAALEGEYKHFVPKAIVSRGCRAEHMFINSLMTQCFFFELETVFRYRLYLDEVEEATSLTNLSSKLEVARHHDKITHPSKGYRGPKKYKSMFN